jgi:hypothetical protein
MELTEDEERLYMISENLDFIKVVELKHFKYQEYET